MFDLPGLLSIALAFLVVAVSPGPANIAVATVSMRSGRSSGLRFGAGLSAGLAFWGIVAASGLGAVLQASSLALAALKFLGGFYLLWLAFKSGRAAINPLISDAPGAPVPGAVFRQGLLLNLSNPKAVVAWMAALAMGLGSDAGALQLVVATAICIGIGILNYAGYALVFSSSGAMSSYRRVSRWIDATVAVLFAAAGLSLLRSALARQT